MDVGCSHAAALGSAWYGDAGISCRLREALRQRGVRNIWASDPESVADEEEEEGDEEVDADEEDDDEMVLDMVRRLQVSFCCEAEFSPSNISSVMVLMCWPGIAVSSLDSPGLEWSHASQQLPRST